MDVVAALYPVPSLRPLSRTIFAFPRKVLDPSKAVVPDELHPSPKGVSSRIRSSIRSSVSAVNKHR